MANNIYGDDDDWVVQMFLIRVNPGHSFSNGSSEYLYLQKLQALKLLLLSQNHKRMMRGATFAPLFAGVILFTLELDSAASTGSWEIET